MFDMTLAAAPLDPQDSPITSLEVLSPEGTRCLGYGIGAQGRPECYWPECGCTPAARRAAFETHARGVPGFRLAKAMKRLTPTFMNSWKGVPTCQIADAFATGAGLSEVDAEKMRHITVDQLRDAIAAELLQAAPNR